MIDKSLHKKWLESKRFVDYGFKVGKGKEQKLSKVQKSTINRYHKMLYGTKTTNKGVVGGIANGSKQYVQPRRKDRRKSLQRSQEQGNGAGFPLLKGVFLTQGPVEDKVSIRYNSKGVPVIKSKGADGFKQERHFFDAKALAKNSDNEVQRLLDLVKPPDKKAAREVISILIGENEQRATVARSQIKKEVRRLMIQPIKGGSGLSPDLIRGLVFRHFPFIGSAKDYRKRRQTSLDKLAERKAKKKNNPKSKRGGKPK